jgi:predicted branched-subunit amino acid permease
LATFIPWNLATIAGFLGGRLIDTPERYGIDVVFPAAMAGLAMGLITGRREIVAIGAGVAVSLLVALAWDPRIAVVVGGLVGPLIGLALPEPAKGHGLGPIPAQAPFGDLGALTGPGIAGIAEEPLGPADPADERIP